MTTVVSVSGTRHPYLPAGLGVGPHLPVQRKLHLYVTFAALLCGNRCMKRVEATLGGLSPRR